MTERGREPTAEPPQQQAAPVSPLEPDPEWEAMEAMMDRIARKPVKVEAVDVPVVTGEPYAAHAVGPMSLHEGIDTQPPQARVIIGEQVLPTQVIPRRLDKVGDADRPGWRKAVLAGLGGLAFLAAAAITLWVIFSRAPEDATGGAASVDSIAPPSSVAAARVAHADPAQPPSTPATPSAIAVSPLASAAAPAALPAASAPSSSSPAPAAAALQASPPPLASASPPSSALAPKLTPPASGIGARRGHPSQRPISHAAAPSAAAKPGSTAPTSAAPRPILPSDAHDTPNF